MKEDKNFQFKPVRPITEEEFEWAAKRIHVRHPRRTICEVIREVYFSTSNKHIRKHCLEIFVLAKRMNSKLIDYAKLQEKLEATKKENGES